MIAELYSFVKNISLCPPDLLEYEKALHRTLELPMTAIYAYDQQAVAEEESLEAMNVMFTLLKAHSTALVMGPNTVVVKAV
jgi:hypothetical protein